MHEHHWVPTADRRKTVASRGTTPRGDKPQVMICDDSACGATYRGGMACYGCPPGTEGWSSSVKALIVWESDGQPRERVEYARIGTDSSFSQVIGGWIEGIAGDDWGGYVDEEGKLKNRNLNRLANVVATKHHWIGSGSDLLVGTVVFVGVPNAHGYDTDVPAHLLATAMPWLSETEQALARQVASV